MSYKFATDKQFAEQFLSAADQLAAFQMVYKEHQDQDPGDWAGETPFPWAVDLDWQEAEKLLQDQSEALLRSAHYRNMTAYFAGLQAWESGTEEYHSKERNIPDDNIIVREVTSPHDTYGI